MSVYINGRFLTQPLSGVQRYAREILTALDEQLAKSPHLQDSFGPIEVLVPRFMEGDLQPDIPNWSVLRLRQVSGARGHIWEQTSLLRASRNGVLLSLCNSGPIGHRAQVLAIHDAHIYQIPQAFAPSYRWLHRTLRPQLARRAAGLITVSDYSASTLSRYLGVAEDRFTVIPNSAEHILRHKTDSDVPARYGLKPRGYILAVGTHSPNKNLQALIQAYRSAGPNLPDLALAGGSVPGLAHQTFKDGNRIHALGRVPDHDLRGLYEGAAAFVFPSLFEGFGIPPLEAMQLGVPVLCARTGAMPEVLGDAPIWFDPRDTGSISHALARFAAMDCSERTMRIELGRSRAAAYRWDRSAQVLVDLLTSVMLPKVEGRVARHTTAMHQSAKVPRPVADLVG